MLINYLLDAVPSLGRRWGLWVCVPVTPVGVSPGRIFMNLGTVVLEDRSGFLRAKTLTRSGWPAKSPRRLSGRGLDKEATQSGRWGLQEPGCPGAGSLVSAREQFNEGFQKAQKGPG